MSDTVAPAYAMSGRDKRVPSRARASLCHGHEPEPDPPVGKLDHLEPDPVPDPEVLVLGVVDARGEEDLRPRQLHEARHEGHVLLEPDWRARPHFGEREQLALRGEVDPIEGVRVAL